MAKGIAIAIASNMGVHAVIGGKSRSLDGTLAGQFDAVTLLIFLLNAMGR